MSKTSIQWTDHSINPIRARLGTGDGHYCEKVSPGCKHCYSSKTQPRFRMPSFQEQRRAGVEHYLDVRKLEQVLRRRKATKYFWCDMTDLFGDWVPDEWIAACWGVMAATPHHTHQVLTKRPERAREFYKWVTSRCADHRGCERDTLHHAAVDAIGNGPWERPFFDQYAVHASGPGDYWPLPNVWLGTSVEDQQRADERIPRLLECPAAVHWVSAEPLLAGLDLRRYLKLGPRIACTCAQDGAPAGQRCNAQWVRCNAGLRRVAWLVVGGESGPGARPFDIQWARDLRDQCKAAGVPFFLKQLGAIFHVPHDEDGGDTSTGWTPYIEVCEVDDDLWRLPDRKGGDIEEWPHDLRVRQWPEVSR